MESNWLDFKGMICPVDGEEFVELKLSNHHTPIEKANVFHWGVAGRGATYPHIIAYRITTEEAHNEYQERKARKREELQLGRRVVSKVN